MKPPRRPLTDREMRRLAQFDRDRQIIEALDPFIPRPPGWLGLAAVAVLAGLALMAVWEYHKAGLI